MGAQAKELFSQIGKRIKTKYDKKNRSKRTCI